MTIINKHKEISINTDIHYIYIYIYNSIYIFLLINISHTCLYSSIALIWACSAWLKREKSIIFYYLCQRKSNFIKRKRKEKREIKKCFKFFFQGDFNNYKVTIHQYYLSLIFFNHLLCNFVLKKLSNPKRIAN